MPKYVVISSHPPESCPSANRTLKTKGLTLEKDMGPYLKKYNVTPETVLHLDPGHKVLWILQAPNSEAVRDMIYASGLSQWNDFEFHMTSSMQEITSMVEHLEPIW
ncbi:MAG TPA: hypothetical protein VMS77_07700 [Conexivisphaerales archaeon]|nr:hypothetical protein [Conexivisphaerales archaeon]